MALCCLFVGTANTLPLFEIGCSGASNGPVVEMTEVERIDKLRKKDQVCCLALYFIYFKKAMTSVLYVHILCEDG